MNSEAVTVLVQRCRMEIYLEPFFDKSTLVNIRKLFRYVFQEPWRNTETINRLGDWLTAEVAETKNAWGKASVAYTNGYCDTSFRSYGMTRKQINSVIAANKKLLMGVKHAKAKHERYKKILAAFGAADTTKNVPNENN